MCPTVIQNSVNFNFNSCNTIALPNYLQKLLKLIITLISLTSLLIDIFETFIFLIENSFLTAMIIFIQPFDETRIGSILVSEKCVKFAKLKMHAS